MKDYQKRFVVEFEDNGEVSRVGIVHFADSGLYGIEFIDVITTDWFILMGMSPSLDNRDMIPYQYYEFEERELKNPKFFHTWHGVVGALNRNEIQRGRT